MIGAKLWSDVKRLLRVISNVMWLLKLPLNLKYNLLTFYLFVILKDTSHFR